MCLLRSVFANPAICKVFHGADSDILWLQRDFHIYVVNLFDTARHPGTVEELCQARAPEVLAQLLHYLLQMLSYEATVMRTTNAVRLLLDGCHRGY